MSSSRSSQPLSESSSALVAQRGSFASFLAPLTQDTFKQVISSIQGNLEVVYQTLSWLEGFQDHQGFELLLDEMLQAITLKIGELLNADRTTIFLLDEEKDELWSIVAKNENGNLLEIRLPTTVGIAGEVACFKKAINIPFDFYADPRSATARRFDQRHNYRTYTMLALPLLNEAGDLVAVVQLLNKLKPGSEPFSSLAERIDLAGFTE
ncbi:MAG TPA: GAF domain-containing protein, partial [Acidobacteriota bacterium]|nr:GAF domain-containing protein [Acidobacteriota bacterium]